MLDHQYPAQTHNLYCQIANRAIAMRGGRNSPIFVGFPDIRMPYPFVDPTNSGSFGWFIDPAGDLRVQPNLHYRHPRRPAGEDVVIFQEIEVFAGGLTTPNTSLLMFAGTIELQAGSFWVQNLQPRQISPVAEASHYAIEYLTGEDNLRTVTSFTPLLADPILFPVHELVSRFTGRLRYSYEVPPGLQIEAQLNIDHLFPQLEFSQIDPYEPGTPGRLSDTDPLFREMYFDGSIRFWMGADTLTGEDLEEFWTMHWVDPTISGTYFGPRASAIGFRSLKSTIPIRYFVDGELELRPAMGRGADGLENVFFGPMSPDDWDLKGVAVSYRYDNAWRRLYLDYQVDRRFSFGLNNEARFFFEDQSIPAP